MRNETKVGILVVVALGALAFLSVKSGSFGLGHATTPMRHLSSTFSNVEGIKEGSAVKMAGVDVGEVTSVKLQPNGSAVLDFDVKKNVALPADVTAQITTSGLIGDRYVSLQPGPDGALGQGGYLTADSAVIASNGGSTSPQDIGNNFAQVADDLKGMTSQLRQVLGNPENAQKLQQIIDGFAKFSNAMGDGGTMDNIEKIAANFEKVSDQLASGKGPLGQLIMGNGEGVSGTMGSLADLGEAAKEFKEVMAKINNGQGSLGKLVNDPETAEKLNNALDTFGDVADRVNQLRTEVAFEGYSLTNEQGIGKGDFSLTLQPRPTRFYTAGFTSDGFASAAKSKNDLTGPYYGKDFGHASKFTLQFGQVFQDAPLLGRDLAVRVGLKNSTGGVGLDTYGKVPFTDKNVKYSADVYDFSGNDTPGSSNPHVDLMARADLMGNNLYGVVGYDNVLSQEYGSPVVGLGLRFQDDDLKYILGKAL